MRKRTHILRSTLCLLLIACTLLFSACFQTELKLLLQKSPTDSAPADDAELPPKEEQTNLLGDPLPALDVFCYGETLADGNVLFAYNAIKEAVARTIPATTIYFERSQGLTADELSLAVALFASDHPECFWFKQAYAYASIGNSVVEFSPEYNFTGEELEAARKKMDAAVDSILAGLPQAQEGNDSYQTALYLHDALASRVEYIEEGLHQSAYGALVDGKAVCAGYAAAYQLLLQKAGIPAYTVIGTSTDPAGDPDDEPIAHAWNAVWLSDGVCVFTDVTWNDSPDRIFHHYFNLSFEEMEQDHAANPQSFRPVSCNHTTFGFFDHNPSLVVTDKTTARELAPLFRRTGTRLFVAVLYYEGEKNFLSWFNLLASDLTQVLTGYPNASTLRWSNKGNEYYVQLEMKYIW